MKNRNKIKAMIMGAAACLLVGGCMQLDDDAGVYDETDTGEFILNQLSEEILPEGAGANGTYDCVAPNRDEYIDDHTNPNLIDEVDTEARAHTILFIFDRSGSMSDGWEYGSKWEAAADSMTGSVGAYASYVSAGAIFFPTIGDCDVAPINDSRQINFSGGDSFLEQWETKTNNLYPEGGTPMNRAFEQADLAIASACHNGLMDKPFRVVVITDGEPNCFLDEELLAAYPRKWLTMGIKTYVVGLPGYGAQYLLDNIARAGGTFIEAPNVDVDSDGAVDAEYDTDGDGVADVEWDTGGVIESNTTESFDENLNVLIE